MKTTLIALAVCLSAASSQSQTLPPDVNAVTLSRLPPVTPGDLDPESQKLLEARTNPAPPGPGPGNAGSYNPKATTGNFGRALGVPTGETSRLGTRMYQLVVLITAREIDQQYEWSAHEPMGLRAGLEPSVIDVVKYDRDVNGLAEKDATVIQFLRALLREHKVSPDLWARTIQTFGRQNTVEIMQLMGDYFTVGTMMNAADQHLPPTRQPLLQAISDLETPQMVFGRVALLGDSAFVARPHAVAGVTKAALDALGLAEMLKDAGANITDALSRYDRERRDFGTKLVAHARYLGGYLDADADAQSRADPLPPEVVLRDYGAPHLLRKPEQRAPATSDRA